MALFKGSPYEDARPFAPPDDGGPAFRGLRERPSRAAEPVLEHPITIGDRLDALSQHYYANPREWRRLADANPLTLFAEDLLHHARPEADASVLAEKVGEVVLVPRRRENGR